MRETVFLMALAMMAGTVVLVAKTIAGAIRGRGPQVDLARLRDMVEQNAAALEESQGVQDAQAAQIAELQERLDFTERLLAQRKDSPALGPGKEH